MADSLGTFAFRACLKTLAVRVERETGNAGGIADFFAPHRTVRRAYYPGLPVSRGHEIAASQMTSFGGPLSFELKDGLSGAEKCTSRGIFP